MALTTLSFILLGTTIILLAWKEWQIQGYRVEIYIAMEHWRQGVFTTRRMSRNVAETYCNKAYRPQVGEPAYTPGFLYGEVRFCGWQRLLFQKSLSRALQKN